MKEEECMERHTARNTPTNHAHWSCYCRARHAAPTITFNWTNTGLVQDESFKIINVGLFPPKWRIIRNRPVLFKSTCADILNVKLVMKCTGGNIPYTALVYVSLKNSARCTLPPERRRHKGPKARWAGPRGMASAHARRGEISNQSVRSVEEKKHKRSSGSSSRHGRIHGEPSHRHGPARAATDTGALKSHAFIWFIPLLLNLSFLRPKAIGYIYLFFVQYFFIMLDAGESFFSFFLFKKPNQSDGKIN